jgi:hypothetical protein
LLVSNIVGEPPRCILKKVDCDLPLGGAGLQDCLFQAIIVGETRPYPIRGIGAGLFYLFVCWFQILLVNPPVVSWKR